MGVRKTASGGRTKRSSAPKASVAKVRPAPGGTENLALLAALRARQREDAVHIETLERQLRHVEQGPSRPSSWRDFGTHIYKRGLRIASRRTIQLEPQALLNVRPTTEVGQFTCTGPNPQMLLVPPANIYPQGWTRMAFTLHCEGSNELEFQLCWDTGAGFGNSGACPLPIPANARGRVEFVQYFPPSVCGVRFDPGVDPGATFRVDAIEVVEITKHEAFLKELWRGPPGRVVGQADQPASPRQLLRFLRHEGVAGLVARRQAVDTRSTSYRSWVRRFDTLSNADRTGIRAAVTKMLQPPRISVIVTAHNPSAVGLRRAIASVRQQLYTHWELCIVDDGSTLPHVAPLLAEAEQPNASGATPAVRVIRHAKRRGAVVAGNAALRAASGDWVVWLDPEDELAEHALYMVAAASEAYPQAQLIYSDEDTRDAHGYRADPRFKPDWNLDLLRSHNYCGNLCAYACPLLDRLQGLHADAPGAPAYDLLLRAAEVLAPPAIHHIARVLYHRAATSDEPAQDTTAAQQRALSQHLARQSPGAQAHSGALPATFRIAWPLPATPPFVSLIIPTRDRVGLLRRCVDSIMAHTDYTRYEILIVDNQSSEPATHRYFRALRKRPNVRIVNYDRPFNFSAMNNLAVEHAHGSVIGLLNNDLEVMSRHWLTEMVTQALRPEVGAVGAKLYYTDHTVQHAGVILGIGGVAGHVHKHLLASDPGYCGRARLAQNFSAVTAACLLVRKQSYQAVGGLDERLIVAFNDIDFCLRLREQGLVNVWTPHAELLHHESASRGTDATRARRAGFAAEVALMRQRWSKLLMADPAYNPNLTLQDEDCSVASPPRAPSSW